ncbi:MAG: hypothetical protein ACTSSH_13840 [Candidatus Heimdallarchaeota archaeon]
MNLKRILKRRKALTPLMIGIIVAASVVAVLFIVLAATVPYINHNVAMSVQLISIRGNNTDEELIFRVNCDYDNGTLTKIEIYKNNELYGEKLDFNVEFGPRGTKYLGVKGFDAKTGTVPPAQVNATTDHLIFVHDDVYTIRIYFENLDGSYQAYSEMEFAFNSPN